MILSGPLAVVASLLALGGTIKLWRPMPAVRGLRLAGVPAGPTAVRALALAEVGLGGVGALSGGRSAAAGVAVAYAGFAAYLIAVRRRGGPLTSCGCFGEADAPVGTSHIVLDLGACALATAAAVLDAPGVPRAVLAHPADGPALLLAVAGSVGLGYLAFAVAPRVRAA